jgi:hypothetical protein
MAKNCGSLSIDISLVPVQNYITAIIAFLIVEMLMTWGFYGMCPIHSIISSSLTCGKNKTIKTDTVPM